MRVRYSICSLLVCFACGQATQPSVPAAAAQSERKTSAPTDKTQEVKLSPNEPVITINGFCEVPAQTGSACGTVITRAQFEKLTEALQPGMSLSVRLKVANAYAQNLRMSAAAEKRGLDKTPAFEEEMRFARMQFLSQDLNRALQADADNIADAELEKYYRKNLSSFEQATVARIFVPHAKQVPTSPDHRSTELDESPTQTAEEVMTRAAAEFRARAANGEDPDKLQVEAYALAGVPNASSNTKMENVRRSTLPPRHESVLDLKPGEASEVFSDPEGGHFIYKMISKETLALQDVRAEIRKAISSQRYRNSMQGFQDGVVFSDAYFNPPGKSSVLPQEERHRAKRRSLPMQDGESGK